MSPSHCVSFDECGSRSRKVTSLLTCILFVLTSSITCSLLCLSHNQRTLVFLLYRPVSVSFQSELRHTLLNQILLHSLSLVFFYSILRMELSLFHRLVVCSVNGWLSLFLRPKIS